MSGDALPPSLSGSVEAPPDGLEEDLRDGLWVGEEVVVPEAEDLPVVLFELCGSAGFGCRLIGVLAAIEFDGEPGGAAGEVEDVSVANELPGPPRSRRGEQAAEGTLRGGGSRAEQAGVPGKLGRGSLHPFMLLGACIGGHPPPAPPWTGGGK